MLDIKRKNKKVIILFLFSLILIIFLLTSLFILFLKPSRNNDLPKEPEEIGLNYQFPDSAGEHHPITKKRCEEQKNELTKKECFEELKYINAILDSDIKICKELINKDKKDKCIFDVARNLIDENLCYSIENKSEKERCLVEIAVDKLDSKICDYFSEEPFEKRECKDKVIAFDIIINEKDISLCDNVRTLEYGPLCFKYMIHKIDYSCEQLNKEQRDLCNSMVIKHSAQSEEECQQIPVENYKKVCLNKIRTGKSDYDIDSDNDGKSDGGELFYNLDPFNPDVDGDGLMDGEELTKYHTDPSSFDTDRDNINDYEEIFTYKTDPNNQDSDNDGYLDGEEIENGYDPLGPGKLNI